MRKYWLLDQHGESGPTALVETDGRMRIVSVLRFGPGITEAADQQAIVDRVVGKVAPTLKPLVDGTAIEVESIEPHAELEQASSKGGSSKGNRAARRSAGQGSAPGGRVAGGPSRSGGRGDR